MKYNKYKKMKEKYYSNVKKTSILSIDLRCDFNLFNKLFKKNILKKRYYQINN